MSCPYRFAETRKFDSFGIFAYQAMSSFHRAGFDRKEDFVVIAAGRKSNHLEKRIPQLDLQVMQMFDCVFAKRRQHIFAREISGADKKRKTIRPRIGRSLPLCLNVKFAESHFVKRPQSLKDFWGLLQKVTLRFSFFWRWSKNRPVSMLEAV